jgi:DNA-directed RNA polymerase specialized sigma24 family protein
MRLPDENVGTSLSRASPNAAGFREWKILLALRFLFVHVNRAARNVFVPEPMLTGEQYNIANRPWNSSAAVAGSSPPARNEPETDTSRHRERLLRDAVFLLGQLTTEERAVILLRDKENLPLDVVARTLGWSKSTTRAHLASARIKLRAGISRPF